jgi:multiple antibiotic resistance protein
MLNFKEIFSAFLILFAVIDIIGSIPLIINIKQKAGSINPPLATVISAVIMVGFLFLGESILRLLGVDIGSFSVAGSIIMAFIAFEMILGIQLFKDDDVNHVTASVVPLAFPLIAGAGTMTTIVSIRAEYESINIVAAILLNMVVVFFVLKMTSRIERFLGPNGVSIIKKVFGIILLAISVKLFSSNAMLIFNQ